MKKKVQRRGVWIGLWGVSVVRDEEGGCDLRGKFVKEGGTRGMVGNEGV